MGDARSPSLWVPPRSAARLSACLPARVPAALGYAGRALPDPGLAPGGVLGTGLRDSRRRGAGSTERPGGREAARSDAGDANAETPEGSVDAGCGCRGRRMEASGRSRGSRPAPFRPGSRRHGHRVRKDARARHGAAGHPRSTGRNSSGSGSRAERPCSSTSPPKTYSEASTPKPGAAPLHTIPGTSAASTTLACAITSARRPWLVDQGGADRPRLEVRPPRDPPRALGRERLGLEPGGRAPSWAGSGGSGRSSTSPPRASASCRWAGGRLGDDAIVRGRGRGRARAVFATDPRAPAPLGDSGRPSRGATVVAEGPPRRTASFRRRLIDLAASRHPRAGPGVSGSLPPVAADSVAPLARGAATRRTPHPPGGQEPWRPCSRRGPARATSPTSRRPRVTLSSAGDRPLRRRRRSRRPPSAGRGPRRGGRRAFCGLTKRWRRKLARCGLRAAGARAGRRPRSGLGPQARGRGARAEAAMGRGEEPSLA